MNFREVQEVEQIHGSQLKTGTREREKWESSFGLVIEWIGTGFTEIGWGVRGFMETESYAYVVSGVLIRHPER